MLIEISKTNLYNVTIRQTNANEMFFSRDQKSENKSGFYIKIARGIFMNRYEVFAKVVDCASFTKAAEELNYTQSAISQMVHTLEEELDTILIMRNRGNITLTADGMEYLPYVRSICNAHRELKEKSNEMKGLRGGRIRIGTFTSVSTSWLPKLMKAFKQKYPMVQFVLQQGEYTNISQWIKEGTVDFGFVNPIAVKELEVIPLRKDKMKAVLPVGHPFENEEEVTLQQLADEPYIQLDEGELSIPLLAFEKEGLTPDIQYKVVDDYTIMAMVEQGLGISILYSLVLKENSNRRIITKPIANPVERTIALAFKNKKTLPIASRYFIDFIIEHISEVAD